jgi:hypothetical protein
MPSPATCPEAFTASPYAKLHPGGKGIAMLPEVVPINASGIPSFVPAPPPPVRRR